MKLTLPYGRETREVEIPDANLGGVYAPGAVAAPERPEVLMARALAEPAGVPRLGALLRPGMRVAIACEDYTRSTPVARLLPALLEEIHAAGVRVEEVTFVMALGTHRPMTAAEIAAKLGAEVARRYRVVNPQIDNPSRLADLGTSRSGVPILIDRDYAEAAFKIAIGAVIPHGAVGFGGGAKIIFPGISGRRTVEWFHRMANFNWQNRAGSADSPARLEIEDVADRVGLNFLVNAVTTPAGEVVGVACGDFRQAFRRAAAWARDVFGIALPGPCEALLITSYPCDLDYWQAIKAIFNTARAVREGGTLIFLTPCPDGLCREHAILAEYIGMGHTELQRRLEAGLLPDAITAGPAYVTARLTEKLHVSLVSGGLSEADVTRMRARKFATVDAAVQDALRRHGPATRISVITHAGTAFAYR